MSNMSLGTRTFKVAAGVALGTFAIAAQADPLSLQGICHLSSVVAGQGNCQLFYQLGDSYQVPAGVRKSIIKIDGIVVAQYVNDAANPVDLTAPSVSGATEVACGVSHVVTAYIARLPSSSSLYEKVGSLPPVLCPPAQ